MRLTLIKDIHITRTVGIEIGIGIGLRIGLGLGGYG